MILTLVDGNAKFIPDIGIEVINGQSFECPDDIGNSLLNQGIFDQVKPIETKNIGQKESEDESK